MGEIYFVVILKELDGNARKNEANNDKLGTKTENTLKAVLLKALKCRDVLVLCKALRSIGMHATKTNCVDKGFIRIATDVRTRIKNGIENCGIVQSY